MDVEKILFNYKTLRGRMIFENKVIEWVKDNDNSRIIIGLFRCPTVVPEFLRTLVFARPRGDDQFADCTFSPSLDMSR